MAAELDNGILWSDVEAVLDEALTELPEKYRDAVMHCYLQNKTCAEAATLLGCPPQTVKSRLARARKLLQGRLAQRGIVLGGTALATLLTEHARAAVPARLLQTTVQAALRSLTGNDGAGSTLVDEVLQTMNSTNIKVVTA